MKLIKFDLPINGIKVKNIEELKDNLTDEIVTLARSGQLARWFSSRHLNNEAERITAAAANKNDNSALFMAICEIIGVEVFPEDVAALFNDPLPAGKKFDSKQKSQYIINKTFINFLNLVDDNSKNYFYFTSGIPKEKFDNAINSYASIGSNENPLVLFDYSYTEESIMGVPIRSLNMQLKNIQSLRAGLLLTDVALYAQYYNRFSTFQLSNTFQFANTQPDKYVKKINLDKITRISISDHDSIYKSLAINSKEFFFCSKFEKYLLIFIAFLKDYLNLD